MGRFRIDDPDIDVAALEARVEARIAEKIGTRYTEGDLEVIRRAALRPRLERHHLSYGVLEEMPQVRGKLPPLAPPPGSTPPRAPANELQSAAFGDVAAEPMPDLDPARDLYVSASVGFKGRVLGLLRRLLRPILRSSSNLEHVLVQLLAEMRRQDQRLTELRAAAVQEEFLRDSLRDTTDRVKDNLDQRLDRTADWVGGYLSQMTGQLEGRNETHLHLLHNLVYELSYARIDMETLQDQISELHRHLDRLEARERILERLSMGGGDD